MVVDVSVIARIVVAHNGGWWIAGKDLDWMVVGTTR